MFTYLSSFSHFVFSCSVSGTMSSRALAACRFLHNAFFFQKIRSSLAVGRRGKRPFLPASPPDPPRYHGPSPPFPRLPLLPRWPLYPPRPRRYPTNQGIEIQTLPNPMMHQNRVNQPLVSRNPRRTMRTPTGATPQNPRKMILVPRPHPMAPNAPQVPFPPRHVWNV